MFRNQAHHILFGLLLYNTFCKNFCNLNNSDLKSIQNESYIKIVDSITDPIPLGKNVTLACETNLTDVIHWSFNGVNITDSNIYTQIFQQPDPDEEHKLSVSQLHINYMDFNLVGNYTCLTAKENVQLEDTIVLNVTVLPRVLDHNKMARVKIHDMVTLYCLIEGYPLNNMRWYKTDVDSSDTLFLRKTFIENVNETVQNVTISMEDIRNKDNGIYICEATGANNEIVSEEIVLKVLDKPQVQIEKVKALGTNMIFVKWTVFDGNDPENLKYRIQYLEVGADGAWHFYKEQMKAPLTYAILEDETFKNNTEYSIRMEAWNSQGASIKSNTVKVKTLDKNPEYIPKVKVTGVSVSSISISWSLLPIELFNYYKLKLWAYNTTTFTEAIHLTSGDHLYMFRDLMPATKYEFQVAACSEYTKKCSPWSNIMNGTTNDGLSDPPENVTLGCNYDNINRTSCLFLSWKQPHYPNGKITHYYVLLQGDAKYINEMGKNDYSTWGPKMKSVSAKHLHTRYCNISANTNYTVKISAVTRMERYGKRISLNCTMPPTTPDKSKLNRFSWNRVHDHGKLMFKLFLPRISERNGAICCYRIYMIRMETNKSLAELPSPEDLHIQTYSDAHRTSKGGAYVAEMYSSASFHSEVLLGDDQVSNYAHSPCLQCPGISKITRSQPRPTPNPTPTTLTASVPITITGSPIVDFTESAGDEKTPEDGVNNSLEIRRSIAEELDYYPPSDGSLDINSNYTGFVEVIVYGQNEGETFTEYSNYFSILFREPQAVEEPPNQILGIVVKILCALILIVLVLLYWYVGFMCATMSETCCSCARN